MVPDAPEWGRGATSAEASEGRSPGCPVEQVYHLLRAIAQRQLEHERPGHTLQATALVNEAYVRLSNSGVAWSGPGGFYVAAAEAMRRILIEHARRRGRIKRGAGAERLNLDISQVAELGDTDPDRIVALDDAFRRLECVDGRASAVVALRFYAGLSIEQTAIALDLSARTVKRDWEFARAWLFDSLTRGRGEA